MFGHFFIDFVRALFLSLFMYVCLSLCPSVFLSFCLSFVRFEFRYVSLSFCGSFVVSSFRCFVCLYVFLSFFRYSVSSSVLSCLFSVALIVDIIVLLRFAYFWLGRCSLVGWARLLRGSLGSSSPCGW